MKINSDINILGGLPDFNLINQFFEEKKTSQKSDNHRAFTSIKTTEAVKRFRKVVNNSLLTFPDEKIKSLVTTILNAESVTPDALLMLFWNFSFNNELLHYLNEKVYFPALSGGRGLLEKYEVKACLTELRQTEPGLQKWSQETIGTSASKYLTLLKKFNLLSGKVKKIILDIYLSDKMFVLFLYWLTAIEPESNLLNSQWLKYCFTGKQALIERLMQKKLMPYISLEYTGDNLKIETLLPYENLYHALSKS